MTNVRFKLQESIDHIRKTGASTFFIDDSGLPGTNIEGVTSKEKIYSAVFVPSKYAKEVLEASFEISRGLKEISRELWDTSKIEEFHFCHIFHGRKEFENVPVEARIGMLRFMATFVMHYPLEIITVGWEEHRNEQLISQGLPKRLGPFNLNNAEHSALFFLLLKLRNFVECNSDILAPVVFCDEGFAKRGMVLSGNVPFLRAFYKQALFFVDSKLVPGIQIADFAAFLLARHKVVSAKWSKGQNLNQVDNTIIELMNIILEKYVNLPKYLVSRGKTDGN